jgi:hypothetical protein
VKLCICGKSFSPDEDFHYLCGDCWDERGRLGDVDSPLPLVSKLGNGKWTREELEEISDSPLWQRWTEEVLDEMDFKMRRKLLWKWVQRWCKIEDVIKELKKWVDE